MKKIIILGSTGSVGTQTLELVREKREQFEIVALSGYSNSELLLEQAREFEVKNIWAKEDLTSRFDGRAFFGEHGLLEMLDATEVDMVVQAMSGLEGLDATIQIIKSGTGLAMANKELLVCYGEEIMSAVKKYNITLIPLDSEHSSIFRLIKNIDKKDIEKIILTCSGGPFFGKTHEELAEVTIENALKHPKWNMGVETTLNSATLMNKAFEVVEAAYLFDMPIEKIEVLVHPECVVHAIIEMKDGSMQALFHEPDMKIPIAYALAYPEVADFDLPKIDLTKQALTFYPVDEQVFPAIKKIRLAYERGASGLKEIYQKNQASLKSFAAGKKDFQELLKS